MNTVIAKHPRLAIISIAIYSLLTGATALFPINASAQAAPAGAQSSPVRRGDPITLNFTNAEIDAVARTMATLAGLSFPMVLKIPDGSFSKGVVKVRNEDELQETLRDLFRKSALLLAQEYLYTDYDWRIGVLNNRAIFACKYFMVRDHWQIYRYGSSGDVDSGHFQTLPTHEVPRAVIETALRATRPIGNGLYGVDIKQSGERIAVIEVNDNPSIEFGVEDQYLGLELYHLIMEDFLRRLDEQRVNRPR